MFIPDESQLKSISDEHFHVHEIGKSFLRSMEALTRMHFSDLRVKWIGDASKVFFPQAGSDVVVVAELSEASLDFKHVRAYSAGLGEYDAPIPDTVRLGVRVSYYSSSGDLIHRHERKATAACESAKFIAAREELSRSPKPPTLWQTISYQGDIRVDVEAKLLAALSEALNPLTQLRAHPDFIAHPAFARHYVRALLIGSPAAIQQAKQTPVASLEVAERAIADMAIQEMVAWKGRRLAILAQTRAEGAPEWLAETAISLQRRLEGDREFRRHELSVVSQDLLRRAVSGSRKEAAIVLEIKRLTGADTLLAIFGENMADGRAISAHINRGDGSEVRRLTLFEPTALDNKGK